MSTDPRFLLVPRNWSVNFLPYADADAETFIGYQNPNKGYGYGQWIEYFESESDARSRFNQLSESGLVEYVELRKAHPEYRLIGKLISEWHDGGRES